MKTSNFKKSDKIILREATLKDVDDIANVYLTSRKIFLSFAPLIHTDESIYQWIRDVLIPNEQVILAEVNGIVVGMISLTRKNEMGQINQFYLLPDSIGKGVGTLMLEKAKSILGSPIQLYTFEQNGLARHFYEKNGFRAVKFSDGSNNEEKCPDILYEWNE